MKTEARLLQHLTGEQAYVLYWKQVYKCRVRLTSVQAIDLNLEIITDDDHTILAFRHDLPDDMADMFLNTGHWHTWNQENHCPELMHDLKRFMGILRKDICLN